MPKNYNADSCQQYGLFIEISNEIKMILYSCPRHVQRTNMLMIHANFAIFLCLSMTIDIMDGIKCWNRFPTSFGFMK